jgi:uncharacterized OB-fold protein
MIDDYYWWDNRERNDDDADLSHRTRPDVGECRECGNDTTPGHSLCLGCRIQRDLDNGYGDVPEGGAG